MTKYTKEQAKARKEKPRVYEGHGDCFTYGSMSGCDENCPALNDNKCDIYKSVDDYLDQTEDEGNNTLENEMVSEHGNKP